jgi:DNA-directed RNA polymerase specialized sigma24 family protein
MAQNDDQVIRLHEALERLAAEDPGLAEIVKLRYFGGASIAEAARTLELAERTAERRLQFARAWLSRELQQEDV